MKNELLPNIMEETSPGEEITFYINSAGDKRELYTHSKVMIHDPAISGTLATKALELQIMSQDLMDSRHVLAEILAKHTGQPVESVLEKTANDCYFDAESAIEFGLADSIIA